MATRIKMIWGYKTDVRKLNSGVQPLLSSQAGWLAVPIHAEKVEDG